MSTKAAAAPEPTCNEEFAQGNREKSFFIPQVFLAVPTNVSLSSSGAEPMVSRQQQENPSNDLQGLGIDFFILSSVIKNIHSPQQDLLLTRAPFP